MRPAVGRLFLAGHEPAVFQVVFLALTVVALRPSVLRSPFALPTRQVFATATLDDQHAVNRRLRARLGDRTAAFIGPAEMLFLTGDENSLPFVYWNAATYDYYRTGPEENSWQTLHRLLGDVEPDWIVFDRQTGLAKWVENPLRTPLLSSDTGAYAVRPIRWQPPS